MKKINKTGRLALTRETVRALTSIDLGAAHGGSGLGTDVTCSCQPSDSPQHCWTHWNCSGQWTCDLATCSLVTF
jgi:hypothetical protein